MIFAAGRGTRLGDLGLATPKALIKINNSTAIEQIINKIIQLDIKEIIINIIIKLSNMLGSIIVMII